jgi:predicted nucleotidyltransferase
MSIRSENPTTHPEVNRLLRILLEGVQAVLGDRLIGLYLDGSLTSGDFDADSDIDFVAVTDGEITEAAFSGLQAMHDRIAAMDSPWAIQLEGSYISRGALRRYDPENAMHPNIERGAGERLKMARHEEDWIIHRHILRRRGVPLMGPEPKTLIDPVSPDDLRHAVRSSLRGWFASLLDDPAQINNGGYQSYTVLSLCRILHTLESGAVLSKAAAAQWGRETLDGRWTPLIDRAWKARHNPPQAAPESDVKETQEFIRYALERSKNNG